MKRKRLLSMIAVVVSAIMVMVLAGCGSAAKPQSQEASAQGQRKVAAQGITDKQILIGTTFGDSGTYATIGVPAMAAFNAVFNRINAKGGIGGRQIKVIHYDDGFDPAKGKALTEKLVEEDKVFLLGCAGAHIITACQDYLKSKGIPLIYVASGLNMIYSDNAPDSNIFPVQPSFKQDGQFIVARVFHEALFGPNKDQKLPANAKVGVMYQNSDTGHDQLDGVMAEAKAEGKENQIIAEGVTPATYATTIQKFKDQGVALVIPLTNDVKGVVAAMDDAQYAVPVFSYYGSSSLTAWSPDTYKADRPCYTTCWSDYSSDKAKKALEDFYDALNYANISDSLKTAYREDNYARAGYVAAIIIAQGLQRLEDSGLDYSWPNFAKVMQQAPFNMITGGSVDYANGQRLGATQEGVFEYFAVKNASGKNVMDSKVVRSFETIKQITTK